MKPLLLTILIAFACTFITSAEDESSDSSQLMPAGMPAGMTGEHKTFEAEIKKVYRLETEDGAVYQSFVIEWKGTEVVVKDMFSSSDKKLGDKITVMMHKIDMPQGKKRIKMIQFMHMDHSGFMEFMDEEDE